MTINIDKISTLPYPRYKQDKSPFHNKGVIMGKITEKYRAMMPEWEKRPLIPIPDRYQVTTFDELVKQPELLDSLIQCYQNVFGGGDIWGEGAVCSKCAKVIDIDEYVAKVNKGDLACGCEGKGKFKQLYTREIIMTRLITQTSALVVESPFIVLMMSQVEPDKVVGFSWGSIADRRELGKRILLSRYASNSMHGYQEVGKLLESLKSADFDKTLYFDEFGVERHERLGFEHVFMLFRLGMESTSGKVGSSAFWTGKKSPMYVLSQLASYDPVFEVDDFSFLALNDFLPILTVSQRCSPAEVQELFLETAPLLG